MPLRKLRPVDRVLNGAIRPLLGRLVKPVLGARIGPGVTVGVGALDVIGRGWITMGRRGSELHVSGVVFSFDWLVVS